MAQPSGIERRPLVPLIRGCALGLFPSDATYSIEIERAPDSGGSPDTGNSESVATVSGAEPVFVDIEPGSDSVYWYRIRHVRDGYTASAWTDWIQLSVQMFVSAYRPAPVLPTVDERPTDDGATGTLTLIVSDPQSRLVKVEAKNRSGNGAEEGTWDELTEVAGEYTKTVDLALKHPSTIRYKITSYNEHGQQVSRERVVPFPLASKPAKPTVTLAMAANGDVTAHVEGDSDTAKVRAKADKSAYPNATAVDAETPINGNSVDTGTLVNLDSGDTAYVTVRAYTSGEVGSDLAKAKLTAVESELNDPPSDPSAVELEVESERMDLISA